MTLRRALVTLLTNPMKPDLVRQLSLVSVSRGAGNDKTVPPLSGRPASRDSLDAYRWAEQRVLGGRGGGGEGVREVETIWVIHGALLVRESWWY